MTMDQHLARMVAIDNGMIVLFMMSLVAVASIATWSHRWHFKWLAADVKFQPGWLLIGAVGVRALLMLRSDLWYDETFTAAVAGVSIDDFGVVLMSDVHPPFAYLPTWLLSRLIGDSEIALRLPSLFFGGLSVWLMYLVTLAFTEDKRAAVMAAWLLAFLPAHIHYSIEARAYTALLCAVLWSILAVLRGYRWQYTIAGWLLPLLHTHGYFYLAALGVGALIYHGFNRSWAAAVVRSGLVGLGWLPFALQQSGDVIDGFWLPAPSPGRLLMFIPDMTLTMFIPPALMVFGYVTVFTVLMVALWRGRWLERRRLVLWSLVFAGVPVMIFIVSWLVAPVFLTRAMLPSAVMILIPLSVYFLQSRIARNLFITALIMPIVVITATPSRLPHGEYFSYCSGADVTYVTSTSMAVIAQYYSPTPVAVFPASDNLDQWLSRDAKLAMSFDLRTWRMIGSGSDVCVVWTESAKTSVIQRSHMRWLLDNNTIISKKTIINDESYTYEIYRVIHDQSR